MSTVAINMKDVMPSHSRSPASASPPLPLLENGDRLTRREFERRYEAMPDVNKAELIEGVVYMPSPVYRAHAWAHSQIITWLGVYSAATPGVRLYDNVSVRLDADNEPQPDALLRIEPNTSEPMADAKEYIETAPELIVEIAASSVAYDLYDKKNAYRRNGVQEYVVWQLYENRLDWFELQEGRYRNRQPDTNKIFHSQVFPGLCLAADALLAGDLATVLAILQQGLHAGEHAAFVQRLTERQASPHVTTP